MHRSARIAAAVAVACTLGGCYTVSYRTDLPGSGTYREERGDFFLWGLAGTETVDLKRICPDGVSRWRSQATFGDGLIGVLTLGLYTRRHITVECAGGTKQSMTVVEPDLVAARRSP